MNNFGQVLVVSASFLAKLGVALEKRNLLFVLFFRNLQHFSEEKAAFPQ
jgi:hypothetical protein